MKLKELLHNIVQPQVIRVTDTGIQEENAWIPVLRTGMTPSCSIDFNIEIKGVTCNPKRVKEGYLFVSVSDHLSMSFFGVIPVRDTGIQEKKRWIPVSSTGMTETSSLGIILTRDNAFSSWIPVSATRMTKTSSTEVTEDTDHLGVIPVRDTRIYIFHPNPQEIYSEIVSRFYQFKHPKYTAAVTGTNGKTSVVEFCRQIWQNAGYNAASIGTLGTYINNDRKDNHNNLTTPDAEDIYATLRDINSKNVEHLALEASSHGIDQYRIHGLKLSAAAFTNFSQDHLDYHKNVSEYLEAKKRLFAEVLPEGETVILNADIDEYSELLKIAEKRSGEVITYGKKGSNITLLKQTPTPDGQHLTIKIDDKIYNAFFPVFGEFQAYNLLCAIGIVISSGVHYEEICIEKLVSPPGRMEKINTRPFAEHVCDEKFLGAVQTSTAEYSNVFEERRQASTTKLPSEIELCKRSAFVFVDYAHTPNALKQSLLSLKWHFNKKIVLVFGCGGNRDQTKRSAMGKIAQMYADRVIVTDDNPRDEDPAKIRHDILLYCPDALETGDRKKAIEQGIDIACNEDMILLVAGKGDEKFQIIGSKTFDFSDVEVIRSKTIP